MSQSEGRHDYRKPKRGTLDRKVANGDQVVLTIDDIEVVITVTKFQGTTLHFNAPPQVKIEHFKRRDIARRSA